MTWGLEAPKAYIYYSVPSANTSSRTITWLQSTDAQAFVVGWKFAEGD